MAFAELDTTAKGYNRQTMFSFFIFIIGFVVGTAVKRRWQQTRLERKDQGEALVVDTLQNLPGLHALINNVTLPTKDGTTQIDHIFVTEGGIFVIETKHHTGWIFGTPENPTWTKVIFRAKFRFQNPLFQNYGHVKTIEALFPKLPENVFIGVVVFTGKVEFRTNLGPKTILLDQLRGFIQHRQEKLLDERQMAYVVGRIEMKRYVRSAETDEYHISNVQRKIAERAYGT